MDAIHPVEMIVYIGTRHPRTIIGASLNKRCGQLSLQLHDCGGSANENHVIGNRNRVMMR